MAKMDVERAKAYRDWKAKPDNKSKGFEDFELDYAEQVRDLDTFGDLRAEAERLAGRPRTDLGRTYTNPGPAPAPTVATQPRSGNTGGLNWSIR